MEFPALPGCLTEGETYEQAVANALEALALHLEGLVEEGLPVPEERTEPPASPVVISVAIPAAV